MTPDPNYCPAPRMELVFDPETGEFYAAPAGQADKSIYGEITPFEQFDREKE